ncbi:unnamed protein product [Polarella glacialis]|uniref:Uncharacterized protein n=1 Tax=Polarella glacialis TaxID=89957 RepID=A0A813HZI7_POLGL|nr:unnamed protein product [Polarella glacialis]
MVLVSCLLVLLLVPLPELGSSDNLEGFLPWLPHDARPREDDSSLQQLEARLAKDDSSLQQLEARLAKAQEVQRQAQEAQRQAELREAQAQAQLRLAEARVPLFSDRATRILGGVLLAVLVLVAAWASAWSKYNSSGDKATPGVSSLVEALIAPDLEVHEGGPAERFSGDQRHQIAVLQREQARLRQTVAESKEQVLQANRRAEEAKSPPRGGRKESTEATDCCLLLLVVGYCC